MYKVIIRHGEPRDEESEMKELRLQKSGEADEVFDDATDLVPDHRTIDSAVLNRV
jgi:hypothetical protein